MKTNPPLSTRPMDQKRAIPHELERMDAILNELRGTVSTLQERISCVMSPVEATSVPEKVPEKTHECAFAESLNTRVREIRSITNNLQSIVDSLEI